MSSWESLILREPSVSTQEVVASLVPPPRFNGATFDSYAPDPQYPSQMRAREAVSVFAGSLQQRHGRRRWLLGKVRGSAGEGVYLDGGFGVGKTHLLAALWHAAPMPRAFGTFVEYTQVVGALGFRAAVEAFCSYRVVCIDEFELDDPGDTVLMSRFLRELADAGVRFAATSNTLPGALGQGRFAAADFQREIQALAEKFVVVRIEGEDYRHRDVTSFPVPVADSELEGVLVRRFGGVGLVACDDFGAVLEHLTRVHPSRYGRLLEGLAGVGWRGVFTVADQAAALRLVVLVDRMYDAGVLVVNTGLSLDRVFSAEMLVGGYRKKYYRALSRLSSLAQAGRQARVL